MLSRIRLGWPRRLDRGSPAPDLGLEFEDRDSTIEHTVAREAEITLQYLELRDDAPKLWNQVPLASTPHITIDVEDLLKVAREHWQDEWREGDLEAAAEVLAMCEQARKAVESSNLSLAKRLLSRAAAQNTIARLWYTNTSPTSWPLRECLHSLPGTNEALRLAPDNSLYMRNLHTLLTAPFSELTKPREAETARP